MRPTDYDFRSSLNDPSWTVSELDNLIRICEEKKLQIWKAGHAIH
jgi:hypothetical protein